MAYENGGGAFLVPYLIVLAFIGRPLYFLEMVLGQFSSSGSVKIWDCVPIAKGITSLTYCPNSLHTGKFFLNYRYWIWASTGYLVCRHILLRPDGAVLLLPLCFISSRVALDGM